MANLPRRNDENPNKATTITKDSTEYISISQGGVAKVIKSADLMTKGNVGLGNVENIAPADMPISEAQESKNTALDTEIAEKANQVDLNATNTEIESNLEYVNNLNAKLVTENKDLQSQISVARKVASQASVETYNGDEIINDNSVSIVGKADDGIIDVSNAVIDGEIDLVMKGKTYTNMFDNPTLSIDTSGDGLADGLGDFSSVSYELTSDSLFGEYAQSFTVNISGAGVYKSLDLTEGHIYLFGCYYKTLTSDKFSMRIYSDSVLEELIVGDVINNFSRLSFLYTAKGTETRLNLVSREGIVSNTGTFIIDGIVGIDLTQLGLDATITTTEQAENYFNFVDGTASVLPKKIVATGKNLFDDEMELGEISDSTGELNSSTTRVRCLKYHSILGGVNYTVSCVESATYITVHFFDINKEFISSIASNFNYNNFTSPINTKYIKFKIGTTVIDLTIQLELGTVATDYEPYTETVAKVPVPLRSLPNGVRDTFDVTSGVHTKNISDELIELATPIITQYEPQPLLATKGSQIQVESFETKTVPNSDDVITFDNNIESVEHVYRYDTGIEVETEDYTFVDNVLTVNNVVDLIVISADVYLSNSTNATLVSQVAVENLNSRVAALEAIVNAL